MNREGGRFSDGLLLGILIGGAIVFLLGTQKGKKVLKLISEEGSGALEGILEELAQEPKKKPVKREEIPQVVDAEDLSFSEHPVVNGKKEVSVHKKSVHRFFRKARPL